MGREVVRKKRRRITLRFPAENMVNGGSTEQDRAL